jgi:radical SAM superfamily enzyme YgiQ (UPF0313 family)
MTQKSSRHGRRPRLFLIAPRVTISHYSIQLDLARILGKKMFFFPLALPLLAALTPRRYDIRIINEDMEPLPQDDVPDIVGITTVVSTIARAYEIADGYRARGVPVVMGGSYATFMTDEVLGHADSVVVGEAEGVWEELLGDLEAGSLKRIYKGEVLPSFRRSPIPRWDLVDMDAVMLRGIEVSRGCPHKCEFCLATRMFGNRMRFRDIDDVVDEIRAFPGKRLFFVDDNLAASRPYLRQLVARLRPLGLSWFCQATADIGDDEDLLRDMAEAGCMTVVIGFESLNPESLKETRKLQRAERYESVIAKIHALGMHCTGSFIVGFDADTLEAFDHILAFVRRTNLWFVLLSVLTAAPGTALRERMQKEGRLLDIGNEYLTGMVPNMRYKNMSAVDLFDRHLETLRKLTDYDDVRQRALRLFGGGDFYNEGGGEVSFLEKVYTSLVLLRHFLLTADASKRRLFTELFALMRRGKVSPDHVVTVLLNMQAFNEWIDASASYRPQVRTMIAKLDRGPMAAGAKPLR